MLMLFFVGLVLGKWMTGSWLWAIILGLVCSVFLSDLDPDDRK